MKKILLFALFAAVITSCISGSNKNTAVKETISISTVERKSLWTGEQRAKFIKDNAGCKIESAILDDLIEDNKYDKTDSALLAYISSEQFLASKKSLAKGCVITMNDIAGKSPKQVVAILGEPTEKGSCSPSGVGKCDKFIYLNGVVEIVYINGLSDWITIYNRPLYVEVNSGLSYRSLDQFSDYTYMKVKTR